MSNKDILNKYTALNVHDKEFYTKTRILLDIIINLELNEDEFEKLTENDLYIKDLVENLKWFGK